MAAKLEQIPVPDMSDSIWAGIEMQLDAGSGAPAKKSRRKFRGRGGIGFMGVVVVVVLVLWYIHKIKEAIPKSPQQERRPAVEAVPPVADSVIRKDTPVKHNLVMPAAGPADSLLKNKIPVPVPGPDSASGKGLPILGADSVLLQELKEPARQPDSVRVPPVIRKPRGVKGITPDDYKISARKDSGQQKY